MDAVAGIEVLILLPLLALSGLVCAVLVERGATVRVATLVESAGVLLSTALLTRYVTSEDSYRDNGTSRWDAYGSQRLTGFAIAIGVGAALALVFAWILRRRSLAAAGFLAATAAAVLQWVAVFANSLN